MKKHPPLVIVGAVLLLATACFGSSFLPTDEELAQQSNIQKARAMESIARLLLEKDPGQEYVQIDDMLFPMAALLNKSGFSANPWPEGKVYYEFDANVSLDKHQYWVEAASLWANVANISFVERAVEPNYIHVKVSLQGVDSSAVGMTGGEQQMTLFSWAAPFAIAHEIGHALGLWHEHQRSNRDDYVTILTDNIQPDMLYNFDIQATTNYGAYDFDSLMHYSKNACTKDIFHPLITIEPKPAYSQWLDLMGQTDHLSVLDAWGMAQRYGGRGTLQAPTITAKTGWLTTGDIIVDWDKVPGATSYRIFYEESDDGPPYTPTQDGTPASGSDLGYFTEYTTTEATISGLTPGQWYHVTLTATTKVLESDYAVSVAARSLPLPDLDDPYEPNNDAAHAYDDSSHPRTYLDELLGGGVQRDDDWYSITLSPDELRVQIQWSCDGKGTIAIGLYSETGDLIGSKSSTDGLEVLDVIVPAAGTYYVKVDGDNIGAKYDFEWNAFPPPVTVEGEGEGQDEGEGEGEGEQVGSLTVVIEPENAVTDGAQWRVYGGAWQNGGVTLSGLAVGPHTVEFKDVLPEASSGCSGSSKASWITPASQTVNITASQTATVTGTYVSSQKARAAGVAGNESTRDLLFFSFAAGVLLVSRGRRGAVQV